MDEYDVSPMDFCFLYDAQNMDGNKQNSFQANLSHAASCIYAQSIAPPPASAPTPPRTT